MSCGGPGHTSRGRVCTLSALTKADPSPMALCTREEREVGSTRNRPLLLEVDSPHSEWLFMVAAVSRPVTWWSRVWRVIFCDLFASGGWEHRDLRCWHHQGVPRSPSPSPHPTATLSPASLPSGASVVPQSWAERAVCASGSPVWGPCAPTGSPRAPSCPGPLPGCRAHRSPGVPPPLTLLSPLGVRGLREALCPGSR